MRDWPILLLFSIALLLVVAWMARSAIDARGSGRTGNERSLVTRARWYVTLRGERAWVRAMWGVDGATIRYFDRMHSLVGVERWLVARGSVWTGHGYARPRLRRWVYGIALLPQRIVRAGWGVRLATTARWAQHPGRYEGNTSQAIAAWLDADEHVRDAGDIETTGYYRLMTGPWPWGQDDVEAYIVVIDSSGFISYTGMSLDIANRILDRIDEVIPTCDFCGEQWEDGGEGEDWNGDTGCHRSCEESREENRLYDQAKDDALTSAPPFYTNVTLDDWVEGDRP